MKLKKVWGLALLAVAVAAICGVAYAIITRACCCEKDDEIEDFFEDDDDWENTFADTEPEKTESNEEVSAEEEESKSEDEKENTVE